MCGITGFIGYKKNDWKKVVIDMTEQISYRGPNGQGFWHDEDVCLGHCRLSIVDLSDNAAQPMISKNGRYVMIYNGEIYNCAELIKKYKIKKNSLKSTSDTEVLLEAVAVSDLKTVLKDCRGMFSIVLYDRKEKKLFLVRDRMGEKPLYYGYVGNTFLFASDLKCMKVFPDFSGDIDREALALYMRFSYIPSPYTIYKRIYKLEPGSMATVVIDGREQIVHTEKYWDILEVARNGQSNLFKGNETEAKDELKRILKRTVQDQMVADVEVGAFLSGGIDSTAIVSMMQSTKWRKVQTFTIGVNDKTNEAVRAGNISDYLGTEHNELYVTDRDCLEVIPKLTDIYSEPFADPTSIPTFLVSQMAKKKVTVSLSGDGGDELFYGYGLYELVRRNWKRAEKIPYFMRNMAGRMLECTGMKGAKIEYYLQAVSPYQLAEQYLCGWRSTEQLVKGIKSICNFYELKSYAPQFQVLDNLMLLDQQLFLCDSHMVKMDRASMYVSLETRAPLLDRDVVEFIWSLPVSYKYQNGIRKKILKDVVYEYVPRKLLEMPKQGFSIPIYKWIWRGKLYEWAAELLDETKLKREGILDERIVSKIWKNFLQGAQRGKYPHWKQIWNILVFEEWLKRL